METCPCQRRRPLHPRPDGTRLQQLTAHILLPATPCPGRTGGTHGAWSGWYLEHLPHAGWTAAFLQSRTTWPGCPHLKQDLTRGEREVPTPLVLAGASLFGCWATAFFLLVGLPGFLDGCAALLADGTALTDACTAVSVVAVPAPSVVPAGAAGCPAWAVVSRCSLFCRRAWSRRAEGG